MVQFDDPKRGDSESTAPDISASSVTGISDIDESIDGGKKQVHGEGRDDKKASKKKRRRRTKDNGISETNGHTSSSKRRNSISKAARDPRDEPPTKTKKKAKTKHDAEVEVPEVETRSPSPVIDFDGLSRPSR